MTASPQIWQKKKRSFLPDDLKLTKWASLEPFYQQLIDESLESIETLENWLLKVSELEEMVYEEVAWRYIRMTCHTDKEEYQNDYKEIVQDFLPHLTVFEDKVRRKFHDSPFLKELDQEKYRILIRNVKSSIALFREENIPLQTEIKTLAQEFGVISGAIQIDHHGEAITLQKAASILESKDRVERKEVWEKVVAARLVEKEKFNSLLSKLIGLRHQVAGNAGYNNFTEYSFASLGRFDYTEADCAQFHESIEKVIKPIYLEFLETRKKKLGVDVLRPYDLGVDIYGGEPLKPFENPEVLVAKTIEVLTRLKPELGEMISLMREKGFLDLGSRIGKAPGGYNYPLPESGIPFIFMNAVGTQNDLVTMVHESGHAVHSFAMQDKELHDFRKVGSEVAELASMTMELLAMDHLDVFYEDEKDLRRAKIDQISRSILLLPWIATIDAFQTWLYHHPTHDESQRKEKWLEIYVRFHGTGVDWSEDPEALAYYWQKQGHIYEVPFYYIEYGMAQLGAIAIWRNYKKNPEAGLRDYLNALKLGNTKTIPEVYEAAGIRFDFSVDYLSDLVDFIRSELEQLGA